MLRVLLILLLSYVCDGIIILTSVNRQAQELLKIIKGQYFNKFVDVEVEGRKVDPPKCMEW